MKHSLSDTVIAPATAPGVGAIAVLRLSGPESVSLANRLFHGKDLSKVAGHTVHFGTIRKDHQILDEVLLTVFHGPNSYTKEDTVEISCHGSPFILGRITEAFLQEGVRLAEPGEFTKRAFLNGRFDLSRAEAVADLIAADSAAAHRTAMQQLRGGFADLLADLREKLINFAALVELELDFGEEEVEFADRSDLRNVITELHLKISELADSFSFGNAIKNGVPVVIAGRPNAGKSTLLNTLFNEEKAIVSEIPGTTRDFIEDELTIEGLIFRFIDTAGLRETSDSIEAAGVRRTQEKIQKASVILHLFEPKNLEQSDFEAQIDETPNPEAKRIIVLNKSDLPGELPTFLNETELVRISATTGRGLDDLKQALLKTVRAKNSGNSDTLVTNARHYEALLQSRTALEEVLTGLDSGLPGDLLAHDIRHALRHLGSITGEIDTDRDILGTIFGKFCIGK